MALTPCSPCDCISGVIPNDKFKQDVEIILCSIMTSLIEGSLVDLEPPLNSTSVIYENSRLVKNSPGNLYLLTGYNSGPDQFIQIFDALSLPANGAVPKVIFFVPSEKNFSYDPEIRSRHFSVGICATNSSTGPTKTIGSANCWFDAQYR